MSNTLETLPTAESIARIQERFVLLDTRIDSMLESVKMDTIKYIDEIIGVFDIPLTYTQMQTQVDLIERMQTNHWIGLIGVAGLLLVIILFSIGLSSYRNWRERANKKAMTDLRDELTQLSDDTPEKIAKSFSHLEDLIKADFKKADKTLKLKVSELVEDSKKQIDNLRSEYKNEISETQSRIAKTLNTSLTQQFISFIGDEDHGRAYQIGKEMLRNSLLEYSYETANLNIAFMSFILGGDFSILKDDYRELSEIFTELKKRDIKLIKSIDALEERLKEKVEPDPD